MLLHYWYLVEVSTEKQCANECYSSAKQCAPSPTPDKDLASCVCCRCVLLASSRHILNMTAAHMVSVPIIFHCFYILTYSSSFVNPIIYALKIPEFRQSLITLCSRRRVLDRMDRKSQEGQDTVTIDLIEPRTLPTAPSYTQQNFEHESMDTKLWSLKTAKKAFPSQPTTRSNKPWIN